MDNIFHVRMNSARVDNEHEFGLISYLFKRLCVNHTWKLMKLGDIVNEHLFSILFMINIYTYLRGNKTSTTYHVDPPSVEEYVNTAIDDAYDGIDADELILERLQRKY